MQSTKGQGAEPEPARIGEVWQADSRAVQRARLGLSQPRSPRSGRVWWRIGLLRPRSPRAPESRAPRRASLAWCVQVYRAEAAYYLRMGSAQVCRDFIRTDLQVCITLTWAAETAYDSGNPERNGRSNGFVNVWTGYSGRSKAGGKRSLESVTAQPSGLNALAKAAQARWGEARERHADRRCSGRAGCR